MTQRRDRCCDQRHSLTGSYSFADFAGDAVGGLFGLAVGASFGFAAAPYLTPVGSLIGGALLTGCVKESVSNVVTNTITNPDQAVPLGESAGACVGGAALGFL
ncbi:hypothetical protein AB0G02_32415 [Actinosynnema sp. NPDC023658]|uniref:hypothetical protein n=1 Tax=Actinosynnema sp. NPDC023658 TaxID=3155465 RepID=UPI00340F59DE